MIEIFRELQLLINGPEAERTKEWYFGKFFTGDINLKIEDKSYILSFHEGEMISVVEGIPLSGFSFGLSGTWERWADFFKHGIFGFATAPAYQNPLGLTVTGSVLCFRQNYNICAHVCKMLAKICRERGVV